MFPINRARREMITDFIWKLQHLLNIYIFKKHENRLVDFETLSKTNYTKIDWDNIGNEVYDIVDVTRHLSNRQKNSIGFANAAINELVELKVALGEKWWSVDSKNWFNTKEGAEYKHIVEEYIDVGHFFTSLGHSLGLSPEQINAAFTEKNKENFSRQDRGY